MRIQVNSGDTIAVDGVLTRHVKGEVERVLARFAARLTRVEIHLSSSGPTAIRCLIEARSREARPVTASAVAGRTTASVTRALGKTRRALDVFFDKREPSVDAKTKVGAKGAKKDAKKTAVKKSAPKKTARRTSLPG